jgi:CDP-diacylglycerol--glycerol-3-phosphate 3-phosphatidyltransferase
MVSLANRITLSRIFLTFVCIGFLIADTFVSLLVSFIVFIIASFTDFLDGFYARKKNAVSDLGRIIDPIADKILIIGLFLGFVRLDVVHLWMIIVIILRELLVTSLRIFALGKGKVLAAQNFGKHKTFSQMIGIGIIYILLLLEKKTLITFTASRRIIFFTLWWIVIITISSGVMYFFKNRKLIKTF